MRAPDAAVPVADLLGDVVIRLRDLGPEPAWHTDRALFGPWRRFEAELVATAPVRERGASPEEAVRRLVVMWSDVISGQCANEAGRC